MMPDDWRARQIERFRDANSENLEYDFLKSLVTIALVSVGGMISIGGAILSDGLDLSQFFIPIVLTAAGGIVAFQGQTEIIKVAQTAKGSRWVRFARQLATLLIGAGVGGVFGSDLRKTSVLP